MAILKRLKLMRGSEASRLSVTPAQGEQICTTDELKVYLGDGNKEGGFVVNVDNVIAVWPDQTDASKKHSLAWWIDWLNGEEATIRIPKGTHEILNDITIPDNICLQFDKGGILKVAATKTLTINGAIEAKAWQIFDGNGAVAGVPKVDAIYVEWFGAKGDGITDSTSAIQKACDWAENIRKTFTVGVHPIVTAASGQYLVSNTIQIKSSCALSHIRIIADGTAVSPAVRIGYNEDLKKLATAEIDAPAVVNYKNGAIVSSWVNSGIGIELCNLDQCKVYVPYVNGFSTGIQCCGYYDGFAYNSIQIGYVINSKVCLKLTRVSDGSNVGWCNENLFENGRFVAQPNGSDWTDTRNILIEQADNTVFLKPSLESANVEYCIELVLASYITFVNGRFEGTGAQRILLNPTMDHGINNIAFFSGYGVGNLTFTKSTEYRVENVQVYYSHPYIGYNVGCGFGGITQGNPPILSNGLDSNERKKTAYHLLERLGHYYRYDIPSPSEDISTKFDILVGYGGIQFYKLASDSFGAAFYASGESTENGTRPGRLHVKCASLSPRMYDDSTGAATLGTATYKWEAVYAVTGVIQTSDERLKTDISSIPDEWLDAWGDVEYSRFKMIDAVQKKGSDNARWHVGLIGQRVKEAFEARGLDAMKIGLLCYDEWDDEFEDRKIIDVEEVRDDEGNVITPEQSHIERVQTRVAGNLYSIRYDEALAMEAAYMRRELERLKSSMASE